MFLNSFGASILKIEENVSHMYCLYKGVPAITNTERQFSLDLLCFPGTTGLFPRLLFKAEERTDLEARVFPSEQRVDLFRALEDRAGASLLSKGQAGLFEFPQLGATLL